MTMLLAAIILVNLSVLTGYTVALVIKRQLDLVQASLFLVIIFLCWTFHSLLVGMSALNNYITPIPLGPLVALNILPLIPEKIVSNQSQIIEDENQA
ncbi:MAG: hypothetical protein ACFFCX_06805 [Candidatus Sifarchaeia archaeon]